VSTSVEKWSEGLRKRVSLIKTIYADHMKFHCFLRILLVLLCIIVYTVVCFVCFYLILYIMYSYCYVYVFLLLCIFRSRYCVSLYCSVYCLCVNVYCTTANVSQANYLLTPWSRVLLEKLTGSAASQEIPGIFGTGRFITVLTSARHLSLF